MVRALALIGVIAQALFAQNTVVLRGDWGKTGISIIPYDSSPGYKLLAESSAEPALSQSGVDLSGALPYSFVLRNNSAQAIVGISARWLITDADGKVVAHDRVWTNLESPKEAMIQPYSDHLVMPINVAPPNNSRAVSDMKKAIADLPRAFATKAPIQASLEVAIFDDGRALGSDSANVVALVSARLDSEREVMEGIVASSRQGQSAVVEYLKGLSGDPGGEPGLIEASREKTAAGAYAKFFSIQRSNLARSYVSMAEKYLAVLIAQAEARLNGPRFAIYR